MWRPGSSGSQRARRVAARVLLPWILAWSAGCGGERGACVHDGDCPAGEVCYADDRCATRGAAQRSGASLANECRVDEGGVVRGCGGSGICRLGRCDPAPEFEGAEVALSDGPDALVVHWRAATEDTRSDEVRYPIYVATASGGQDFSSPTLTVVGETRARLEGLEPHVSYWVVVRAEDEYGQRDDNTREVRGVPGCVEYATQVQPIFDARCTGCHGAEVAYRDLRLDSFEQLSRGSRFGAVVIACRATDSPLFDQASTVVPPFDHWLPEAQPPLDDAQVETLRRWIDQGATPSCPPAPDPCADGSPPRFAGLEAATYLHPARARLCWSAADDDVSPGEEIVYEIHEARTSGGQDFAARPVAESAPGATCVTLDGRVPGARHCWVVRARDGAGNRDANTIERCMAIPAASCVDYEDVLQPLFDRRCIHCHGGPAPAAALSLERWAGAIAGGRRGPAVVGCAPEESLLHRKVWVGAPADGPRMPRDGPPYLSDAEVEAIRSWIAAGARERCADLDPCVDGSVDDLRPEEGG